MPLVHPPVTFYRAFLFHRDMFSCIGALLKDFCNGCCQSLASVRLQKRQVSRCTRTRTHNQHEYSSSHAALFFCSSVPSQVLLQLLSLVVLLSSSATLWRAVVLCSGSETPVVVVLSGSMEPTIWRGDILFLWQDHSVPYSVGEIIVYRLDNRPVPIIHRIIELDTDAHDGRVRILTKGDNNPTDDRPLYNSNRANNLRGGDDPFVKRWLSEDEVLGRTKGYIPQVGKLTLFLHEFPALKWMLCAALLVALLSVST